ncbi:MAG: spore maturation protein [Odoribacteraceae bacterium]|jgi:spore maturation protein SpmA|nr:spore maturation protein [Odoribacteraceae bacterium]
MVLNYIWTAFFLIAFIAALLKLLLAGDVNVFSNIIRAAFDASANGFTIALGLTGVLSLWMGVMKIGEQGGATRLLSRLLAPLFRRLFPELPPDSPAHGAIALNLAANMLGLDNAATPAGLKAMQEMQALNPDKSRASNAQIMLLVLNTSGLTLVPVSIMVYRAACGAANPADVFLPILLATYFSTLVGLVAVSLYQRVNLLHPVVLAYLGGATLLVAAALCYFSGATRDTVETVSSLSSGLILFLLIVAFILAGIRRRVNVYDAFIDGAKEGFAIAVKIIPYLVAILVAIAVFRAAGCMEIIENALAHLCDRAGWSADVIPALPAALMKPLSGSGARGLMIDVMNTHGADSFAGRLASIFQGATDTTFYIIAVYFGSVNIKRVRHAIPCGLLADLAGILAAIFIAYLFFA